MGASRRWFKTLLGLRNNEKSNSSIRDDNSTTRSNHSTRDQNCDTDEVDNVATSQNEVQGDDIALQSPPSFTRAQIQATPKEEWAAKKIQKAFKQVLSSRATRKTWEQEGQSVVNEDDMLPKSNQDYAKNTNDRYAERISKSSSIIQSSGVEGKEGDVLDNELNRDIIRDSNDAENTSFLESSSLPTTSVEVVANDSQVHLNMIQEHIAATQIQRAFRQFLARRALRALKGLVRLQALARGHAVRKQIATTLNLMQSLVKVQVCVQADQAKRARKALECRSTKQTSYEHPKHEDQVKNIEEGWCGTAGSVEEINTKILKRKEAAAKREKAKAYALARQWQARPQVPPPSADPQHEQHNSNWNWIDRWMMSHHSKLGSINSDSSSSIQKQTLKTGNGKVSSSVTPRSISEKPDKLARNKNSEQKSITSRSQSTPRERMSHSDKEKLYPADKTEKKRLSLPGSTQGTQLAKQTTKPAVKRSTSVPNPRPVKLKIEPKC